MEKNEFFIIGFRHQKRLYEANISLKFYNQGKKEAMDGNVIIPSEFENNMDYTRGFYAGIYELGKNHGLLGEKNIPSKYIDNSHYLKGYREGIEESIMNIVLNCSVNKDSNNTKKK